MATIPALPSWITWPELSHLAIILFLYICTWAKSIFGGFCIDDDFGLQQFSDKWRPEGREKDGKIVPELLVDYYNYDIGKDDQGKPITKSFNNRAYNPHLGFPGAFMRWHRLQVGKTYRVIGKNKKGHDVYGWVQSPMRHHVWSLIWYAAALILCYNFLSYHFGSSIAFPATLLFAVHPVINQCVAWISGINYIYCLTFLLANYNVLQAGLNYYWTIPLTLLLTALSSLSLLVGCFNFAILWTLGYGWEAFAAFIVGALFMLKDGLGVVNFRRGEFKKQNMTATITPNIRKPIVMLKTLWYYIRIVIFPKRLGLYHTWGYHYSRKDEEPTPMFWLGLASFLGMVAAFLYGNSLVKFCVVWFLSYIAVFSNFITANQFVVERYAFIPSLAYCIIFAWLIYPYPELFWLLLGLYAMRSIMHVWTFRDHVSFYLSNVLNFPKSEVAYGNLGCAYQAKGMSGAAFDFWTEATKINPHYDVPWYNMHSLLKSSGNLEEAKRNLQKCMDAKVVHFKDSWERDMKQLDDAILKKQAFETLNRDMNEAVSSNRFDLVQEIKKKMDVLMDPKTVVSLEPPKQVTT